MLCTHHESPTLFTRTLAFFNTCRHFISHGVPPAAHQDKVVQSAVSQPLLLRPKPLADIATKSCSFRFAMPHTS